MLNRAYSIIDIKSVNDEQRVIEGIASTPRTDRIGDVVEPMGAVFKTPLPLLLDHKDQVGHVEFAKPNKDNIPFRAHIPKIVEPGAAKDLVDKAWHFLKYKLRQFASIGFRPLENGAEAIKSGGVRFKSWEWLELSLVQIPAQPDAVITTLKSIDADLLAASGQQKQTRVVHLTPPGASGRSQPTSQEGAEMKTIGEQIVALENKRAASAAAMEAVMQKTLDEDRTSDAGEQEPFDTLAAEVEAIDKDLVRLRQVEKAKALAAKPVIKADTAHDGATARGGSSIVVRAQPKLPPGIAYAQMVRCELLSQRQFRPPVDIAREFYGPDSIVVRDLVQKAAVPAGTTIAGNWLEGLIGDETSVVGDFIAFLRAQTILGRFGQGGIPALRAVMFRTPLITQTGGGNAYWTGESKAKALTSFSFSRTTIEPLKLAAICVLTNEAIRYSSPKADVLIRDQLAAALRERLDIDFIDPAKTAVAGVSPASITNGADTVASTGDAADDVRLDIRALWAKYTAANNPPSSGVWVMSSNNAVALAMMTNPLGQSEWPGMSMSGGVLGGMPVIASDYVDDIVVLLNASDIYLADEGGIEVKSSTEASLEMSDAPAHTSGVPTPAQLVSMFQTNSTALLVERTVNYMRRQDPAVVYLTGVSWGGAVPSA